jgi:DNA-binding NtrC family response regulator
MARVLAVDDEAYVLRALQRELRSHPFDLVTESDPAVALERVRQEEFDLVISDCRMPGIDGVRLLTEVRRRHPHTVRIMLSGHADMQDLLLSINEAGIYRFISKPWSMPELSSAVTEALQQRRALLESARAKAIAAEAEDLQQRREMLEAELADWQSPDPDATVINRAPIRWGSR